MILYALNIDPIMVCYIETLFNFLTLLHPRYIAVPLSEYIAVHLHYNLLERSEIQDDRFKVFHHYKERRNI